MLEDLDTDVDIQAHGSLNTIYGDVAKECALRGWDSVDAVIIGGDFQVGFI